MILADTCIVIVFDCWILLQRIGTLDVQKGCGEDRTNHVTQSKAEVENAEDGAATLCWPKLQGNYIHSWKQTMLLWQVPWFASNQRVIPVYLLNAKAGQLGNTTSSRTITEVKECWDWLLLRWDTIQVLSECCCRNRCPAFCQHRLDSLTHHRCWTPHHSHPEALRRRSQSTRSFQD